VYNSCFYSVKQDIIKGSLDFLASNDYEYMGWIFETLDFLTEIELFSDKCGQRELLKLEDDFRKDIARNAKKTKANLWKYIKEDT
jgi:hypothetical protein